MGRVRISVLVLAVLFCIGYQRAECAESGGLIPLYPFKTDGCSCFPSGGYDECCAKHDLAYWYGGSNEEREAADIQLMKCAADKGYPKTGIILRFGASVGGVSWLPTPFRWGFGWKYPQSGPVK
jgi:hypothetical protein